jgi:hypothetical protein
VASPRFHDTPYCRTKNGATVQINWRNIFFPMVAGSIPICFVFPPGFVAFVAFEASVAFVALPCFTYLYIYLCNLTI